MRTTIEIKDKLRAELLKRAAHQGEKGFSTSLRRPWKPILNGKRGRRKPARKPCD